MSQRGPVPTARFVLAAATKTPQAIDFVGPLVHALWKLWPLWALMLVIGALRLAAELSVAGVKARRLRRAGMPDIDRMTGPAFEQRLGVLFKELGYRTEIVGRRGDFGGDLLVTKDGIRCVVQAK